jgi:hypothetical protein
MSAKKRRIDQLQVISPCSSEWDRMSGDDKKRFCAECDKFVYDFSRMTTRQVEAIVSIHRGRMCARITRRPNGSLLTLETPPVHPVVARRAPPVVNATLAAILSVSVPATALNIDASAAQITVRSGAGNDIAKTPYGGGEASVGGAVFDPQNAAIANAVVKLISDAGEELKTKTSAEGEFTFTKVPFGAYIMLVEADDFYTHVNPNIIVDTPYDTRLEVAMKKEVKIAILGSMGGGGSPESVFDLYRESDLVAIAQVGRSTVIKAQDPDDPKQLKTALRIISQFKGENNQQVIHLYHWYDDFNPAPFKSGDKLLVLLRHRESEEGKLLDGYEAAGWGAGVKKLDDGALAVYRQRIEELTAIVQQGDPDPAEVVEWLVRCVEEPVMRQEGASKLLGVVHTLKYRQEQEQERENKAKASSAEVEESSDQSEGDEEGSNEQSDTDDNAETRESLRLAAALTQDHKTRLANALFGIAELSEGDMELAGLVQEFGDERLGPYLTSQLGRVADATPEYAESLMRMIAEVINDEDLKRLSNEYGDSSLAARVDRIEYVDESGRQDSTQNQSENRLTIAAIKRSAMLKDFLKLVEYKTNR